MLSGLLLMGQLELASPRAAVLRTRGLSSHRIAMLVSALRGIRGSQ